MSIFAVLSCIHTLMIAHIMSIFRLQLHISVRLLCVCVCCVCKWDSIRFMITLEMRTRKSWFLSLLSRFYLHAKCFDQHLCTAMNLFYRLKLPRWEGVAWSVVSINLHCRQAIWSLFEHTSFEWVCAHSIWTRLYDSAVHSNSTYANLSKSDLKCICEKIKNWKDFNQAKSRDKCRAPKKRNIH